MTHDHDNLSRLLRDLARDDAYTNDICPGDALIADFALSQLAPRQHTAVAQHIGRCRRCTARMQAITEALERFDTHQAPLLDSLLDITHLPAHAQTVERIRLTPDKHRDTTLRSRINAWRRALESRLSQSLLGLQADLALASATPGYRSAATTTIDAPIITQTIQPDDVRRADTRRTITFAVVDAHLDNQARCIIDLSTTDPRAAQAAARGAALHLQITIDNQSLLLPPAPLRSDGRVTSIIRLPIDASAKPLPIPADCLSAQIHSPE